MYSPIQKSEEQVAEMRKQTAQVAGEVATLRETLQKLITKLEKTKFLDQVYGCFQ